MGTEGERGKDGDIYPGDEERYMGGLKAGMRSGYCLSPGIMCGVLGGERR